MQQQQRAVTSPYFARHVVRSPYFAANNASDAPNRPDSDDDDAVMRAPGSPCTRCHCRAYPRCDCARCYDAQYAVHIWTVQTRAAPTF